MSSEGKKEYGYILIGKDEIFSEQNNAEDDLQPSHNWLFRHKTALAVLCILTPSLASNAFLSFQNFNLRHLPDLGRSSYSI